MATPPFQHQPNGTSQTTSRDQSLVKRPSEDPIAKLLLEQLLQGGSDHEAAEPARNNRRWSTAAYTAAAKRRWKPMLITGLLIALAVGFKLRPIETLYSATSVMLLPIQNPNSVISPESLSVLSTLGAPNVLPDNVNTQIAIITSPSLVERAIGQLTPQERESGFKTQDLEKAAILANTLAVPGQSDDLITITVMAANKSVAIKLANKLIDVYDERSTELANLTNQKNIKVLQQQVGQSHDLMMKAKEELRKYKEKTGILNIDAQLTADATSAQEMTVKAAQARLAVLAGAGEASIQSDTVRSTLQLNLRAAQDKYQEVLKDFLPSAPEAQKAARDVHDAQNALDLRTQTLVKANNAQLQDATRALDLQRKSMAALPADEVKLGQLQNKVDLLTNTYKLVYDRYTGLTLGQSAQIDTATALTPAEIAVPASRSWIMVLAVALIAGGAFSLLTAGFLESRDNSLHETDELRALMNGPVLGNIPLLTQGSERRLPRLKPSDPAMGMLLEACRLLRANIFFASKSPLQSVLITSADPGEGKSLCAYNLATAMALDGRRVLLVDCDLRRPSQHIQAGCKLEPGLVTILQGQATLEEAVCSCEVANLWLLPAGALPGNPPELLGSAANRALLQQLQERFDLLIIDSPPILSLADAQVLGSLANGVLLVVAAHTTSRDHVRRAHLMLRHAGANVLGTIFNKVTDYHESYPWQGYYQQAGSSPAFTSGSIEDEAL